ncbi:hypothetical protein [Paraglaciecola polaris]|uniref:Uncharacterized protein n=1 Tax=Paraglaciecola polaris LMG 21857 TaxID=1129793 RepID=K6ZC71_9ALTE|nr:hypothetical protein [Paraglaciecola polaris]GAC33701.1 hypothetical protein GPLA_2807 [Paraglaciecola polaris LMG 21857]|tara:strand:+ start:153 stop:338 length:186 start_codon:yes stop_codon:yes gene_type:complete
MTTSKYSDSQILAILNQAEGGINPTTTAELKKLDVNTFMAVIIEDTWTNLFVLFTVSDRQG